MGRLLCVGLYLRNAALLAPAVIIKLTRRKEGRIREGGTGEGEIEKESLKGFVSA